jgi:hypothetical protein
MVWRIAIPGCESARLVWAPLAPQKVNVVLAKCILAPQCLKVAPSERGSIDHGSKVIERYHFCKVRYGSRSIGRHPITNICVVIGLPRRGEVSFVEASAGDTDTAAMAVGEVR